MSEFDVFLCYNRQDQREVEAIANQLKQQGLKPWLDVWEVSAGESWQDLLEKQIEQTNSAAVFVGKSGFGSWQKIEINALIRKSANRNCSVIPVFLQNAPRELELLTFLKEFNYIDSRCPDTNLIEDLICGINSSKPPDFDLHRNESDNNSDKALVSKTNKVKIADSISETVIKSRYKIIKYLGARNCEIYLAQDLDFPGEPKCIVKKLASTKMSERDKLLFEREVKALYKIGIHDQIPSLLANFKDNNDFYLVEEYIEGQALSEELIGGKQWNEGEVITFLE